MNLEANGGLKLKKMVEYISGSKEDSPSEEIKTDASGEVVDSRKKL